MNAIREARFTVFEDIQYSIREGFKEVSDTPFLYVKNGEDAPKREEMPVLHLIDEGTSYAQLSKLRETMQVTIQYKIGIFARDPMELTRLQGQLSHYFMFHDNVPLVQASTKRKYGVLDMSPSFMGVEYMKEINRESENYHRSLMVDVTINLHKNLGGI